MICRHTSEHYIWGDDCHGWHMIKSPELSIILERMPPQTAEMRHYHTTSRQFFFVLSGVATLEIDGTEEDLHPYEGAEVLAGMPHQLFNRHHIPLEFLVISQPPSHGDRIAVPRHQREKERKIGQ